MADEINSLEELKKHMEGEAEKTTNEVGEDKHSCCGGDHGSGKKLSILQMFLLGIGALLLILLAVGFALEVRAVKQVSQNKVVVAVAKALNLSAAKINGMSVSYADYIEDLQTLNRFYEKTPEAPKPTPEQISDQVISRLLANKLIVKLSKEFNLKVDPADVEEFKKNLLTKFADEAAAEKELQDKYGWTMNQYVQKVVNPILLEQKLQKAFEESTREDLQKYDGDQVHARHILFMVNDPAEDAKVKAEAQSILNQIKKGADFVAMAKQYGSDGTKDQGGDLGWFGKGSMVPEFEAAVFALKAGELDNELVKTQYGYHIVKVDEVKKSKDYYKYMNETLRTAKIEMLLPVHNPFEQLQVTADASAEAGDAAEVTVDSSAETK